MKTDIEKILTDFQPRHSRFQIERFIIGMAGDDWARYKQIQREIDERHSAIQNMQDGMRIEGLSKKWGWPFGKKAVIRKRLAVRARIVKERDLAEYERELAVLVEIGQELYEKFKNLDYTKRAALESKSWKTAALKMAGVDFIVSGRLSQPTIGMILALPQVDQAEVLDRISPKNLRDPHELLGINADYD